MKTSWKITLLFLLIQQNVSFAQLSWARVWDHRYGGTGGDYLMGFCPASNHGYILAGKQPLTAQVTRLHTYTE